MIQDEIDFEFDKPVSLGGELIQTVKLREPLVKDQLAAQKGGSNEWEQTVILLGLSIGYSPEDIRNLPLRQFKKLNEKFLDFLG